MRKRICVVSNSHAASLKDGLEHSGREFDDWDVVFFAAPGRKIGAVRADEERRALIPAGLNVDQFVKKTSGGLDHIPVDDFDAFFFYGLFFTLPWLDVRLSAAVKNAAIDGALASSFAHTWMECACQLTTKPMFIAAEPLLADIHVPARLGKRRAVSDAASHVAFDEICRSMEDRGLPGNVTYLWQDPATISSGFRTKVEFSVGSRRLSQEDTHHHPETDIRHMNGAYGAIVLRQLTKALTDATAPAGA